MNKFAKNAEDYIKNSLGFKRKYLSDKSGYWYEKIYRSRFFSVHIITAPKEGYAYVEISSRENSRSSVYPSFIRLLDRSLLGVTDRDSQQVFRRTIRELNSYWRKFREYKSESVKKVDKKYKLRS